MKLRYNQYNKIMYIHIKMHQKSLSKTEFDVLNKDPSSKINSIKANEGSLLQSFNQFYFSVNLQTFIFTMIILNLQLVL